MLKTTLWVMFSALTLPSFASMVCPPDKHLKCDDDITNLQLTGMPTLFGSHANLTPVYEDQYFTNACNVGHVVRKWYLDLNNNNQADQTEPVCHQNIYLSENNYGSVIIKFPKDIVVNCLDDIPYMKPEITSRPCDLIGVSYRDEVFELLGSAEEGCKKILRKFTVINWCDYTPNSPNTGGVWYGTQVIKVIDKEKPEFTACKDVTIGFNEGCKSRVTLTNNAIDPGACTSNKMSWIADVDILGDGKIEYQYSNAASGIFFLPLQDVGQEIKITLPELLAYGKHKVTWRVKDACGNISSCTTNFTTMDNKPPTPYCIQSLSVALDGKDPWKLKVPASIFSLGAVDNCTATPFIKYSFSPDPADSMRFYDCTNAGFQNLRVYATDLMGNKDFCAVYLTVYDNGSCQNTLVAAGKVMQPSGRKVMAGSIIMQGNQGGFNVYGRIENGGFQFKDVAIYNDVKLIPAKSGLDDALIDLNDYNYFKKYLAGDDTLTQYGMLAADINDDKKVDARDFLLLKDLLLKRKSSFGKFDWRFVPSYIREKDLTLQNYNPVYDAKRFNGYLDFTAFAKGDLSETRISPVSLRTAGELSLVTDAPVEIDGIDWVPVTIDQAENIDVALLSLHLPYNEILVNHPTVEWSNTDNGLINVLIDNQQEIKEGETLFYIPKDQAASLLIEGEVKLREDAGSYKIKDHFKSTGGWSYVYPNPAQSHVNLLAPAGSSYAIAGVSGLVLKSGVVNSLETVDIVDLTPGVYVIHVVSGKNTETHKFLKF